MASARIHREPAPDLVVLSGSAGLKDIRAQRTRSRLWAHSLDYDTYLSSRHKEFESGEPYAVFLDEDMSFHPDYDHSGIEPPTAPGNYYPAMSLFFERFERANGVRVIVAAHPRSHYELHPELWNGRTIIQNNTALLVRDADLVMGHATTSLSFAVLWRKPIVFLSTNDLDRSYMGPGIALRSSLLQRPLINVDERPSVIPNQHQLLDINEDAYSRYIAEFIKTPGTPDLPVWEMFSEFLKAESALVPQGISR
jgi:hypothetical protein